MSIDETVSKYFEVLDRSNVTDPELGFAVNRIKVMGDYTNKIQCLLELKEAFPNETFSLWITRPNQRHALLD